MHCVRAVAIFQPLGTSSNSTVNAPDRRVNRIHEYIRHVEERVMSVQLRAMDGHVCIDLVRDSSTGPLQIVATGFC